MIAFARRNRVRRFIFVSSPSVYAQPRDMLGIREEEAVPGNRLTFYIESKLHAEALLRAAHSDGSLPELTIIRPRGLIGVGDPSLLPRLLEANRTRGIPLFNGGQNLVDITAVENVALALRLAAEVPGHTGGTYNITNGEPRRFLSILEEFFTEVGEKPRYIRANLALLYGIAAVLERVYALTPSYAEPPFTRYTVATLGHSQTLDISRARAELGYVPRVSLSDGLAAAAAHIRSASRA
jgi:nucleoside-diphosphate-sugar epimerase